MKNTEKNLNETNRIIDWEKIRYIWKRIRYILIIIFVFFIYNTTNNLVNNGRYQAVIVPNSVAGGKNKDVSLRFDRLYILDTNSGDILNTKELSYGKRITDRR